MLKGIDSSQWQSGLPDATINADFIIFKATEGVGFTDPDCNASYAEAKNAGKLLGVYHFARPDGNDPISEARWFYNETKGYHGEAILVLDWETEPKGNVGWAKQWLDEVQRLTGGIKPMIYMSSSVANGYDWSPIWNDYALWVAQYPDYTPRYNYNSSGIAMPEVNWPYGYAMWQWTSSGIIDGWGGRLDCNEFYGDAVAWHAFAKGHPEVTVTPPVPPTQPPIIVVQPPTTPPEPPVVVPDPEPEPEPPVVVTPPTEPPVSPPVKISFWQMIINWIAKLFRKG